MPKISFGGKDYDAEIVDGKYFVEGKTLDEFIQELSKDDVVNLASIGKEILKAERKKFEKTSVIEEVLNERDVFDRGTSLSYAKEAHSISLILDIVRPEKMGENAVVHVVKTILFGTPDIRKRDFENDEKKIIEVGKEVWMYVKEFYQ